MYYEDIKVVVNGTDLHPELKDSSMSVKKFKSLARKHVHKLSFKDFQVVPVLTKMNAMNKTYDLHLFAISCLVREASSISLVCRITFRFIYFNISLP